MGAVKEWSQSHLTGTMLVFLTPQTTILHPRGVNIWIYWVVEESPIKTTTPQYVVGNEKWLLDKIKFSFGGTFWFGWFYPPFCKTKNMETENQNHSVTYYCFPLNDSSLNRKCFAESTFIPPKVWGSYFCSLKRFARFFFLCKLFEMSSDKLAFLPRSDW